MYSVHRSTVFFIVMALNGGMLGPALIAAGLPPLGNPNNWPAMVAILPNLLQRQIFQYLLTADQDRQTILAYDSNEARSHNLQHWPARNAASWDLDSWVRYPDLLPGTRMLIRVNTNTYDSFLVSLLAAKLLSFPTMRDMRNFLEHLEAYAPTQPRPRNYYLARVGCLLIRQPRGPYAEQALEMLERCHSIQQLYIAYCRTCLNYRAGPGKTNATKRVMGKWRNLHFPPGRAPGTVFPCRGWAVDICQTCRQIHRRGRLPWRQKAHHYFIVTGHGHPVNHRPFDRTLTRWMRSIPCTTLDGRHWR